ncbi:hypothetical protein MNBD_GAMMA24-931 [hydrothermal vent metagenome]|uniref:Uncharacterized protein n=1 Tax=hydrothermal vent metagenome TaxID=652676 RepID=A0A3B1BSI7_9ZZZZ
MAVLTSDFLVIGGILGANLALQAKRNFLKSRIANE